MNVFESLGDKAESASKIGERYVKSTHQYYKLKIFQQLAVSVSIVAKLLVVGACLILGIIFAAVAGANYLGQLFNSISLGYIAIAGLFFIMAILLYITRKTINKYILQKMSVDFFSEDD